ncbi:hypothetical protein EDC04DRAFT_314361 [Pisolithus marmoratus]|nr:hypothetical protein EDC04DRAFT_314361 [Pisolithus marmoratus]
MSVAWALFNSSPSRLVRRGLESDVGELTPMPAGNGGFSVRAIIPGVTVPLSHFPIILLALCICQIVHEAGHAIAAATRRVPILFSGFALTVVFPSVFVAFPVVRLGRLRAVDRLRVVTAGCFHNLAFWCLLYLTAWTKINAFLSEFLFEDVSHLGKVVIGVHPSRCWTIQCSVPQEPHQATIHGTSFYCLYLPLWLLEDGVLKILD